MEEETRNKRGGVIAMYATMRNIRLGSIRGGAKNKKGEKRLATFLFAFFLLPLLIISKLVSK